MDWLTFTADVCHLDRFLDLLGMGGEWVSLPQGQWGYPVAICRGTTKILSGVRGEICVVCTGQTCGELREAGISDEAFLAQVIEVAKNISRIDVAFDTLGPMALSLRRIKDHLDSGAVVSRFRTWDERSPRKMGSDVRQGWTITCGNRSSQSFLRFYDKGLETGTYTANQWVRCELEFKKDNAMAMARLAVEHGIVAAAGVLANLIEFKAEAVDQTDSNKSRHEMAGWWADFLASAERIRLGLPSPKPSLERAVAWVKKQVGPTLAAIVEALGGDSAILHEIVDDGYRRQRVKHRIIATSGFLAAT